MPAKCAPGEKKKTGFPVRVVGTDVNGRTSIFRKTDNGLELFRKTIQQTPIDKASMCFVCVNKTQP